MGDAETIAAGVPETDAQLASRLRAYATTIGPGMGVIEVEVRIDGVLVFTAQCERASHAPEYIRGECAAKLDKHSDGLDCRHDVWFKAPPRKKSVWALVARLAVAAAYQVDHVSGAGPNCNKI